MSNSDIGDRNRERDAENLPQYVRQLEAIVENSPDAIAVKDTDGRYQFANEAAMGYVDYDLSDIVGTTDAELFGEETAREIRRRERRVLDTEDAETFEKTLSVADGERVFELTLSPYYDAEDDLAGTVVVCRDLTDRKVREQMLENQRDELATLDRINEVVQTVIQTLIGEPTHEEIAQAVCDRLVSSELYQVAWVGKPDPSGSEMTDVVGAGLDEETRELIDSIDAGEDSEEPVPQAYYTGETQIVQNVSDDDSLPEHRREDILDRGDRSGIAVPIRYGDTTYGVLTLGSDRVAAFSDREADALEVLGRVTGFAIGAVKHRRLALSDTVVELELRLTDSSSFYVAASERLDCTLQLEGMATGPDGTLLCYDSMSGTEPDEVLDLADEWSDVEDVRLVSDHDDEALFEFTLSGSSAAVTLSEYGAKTSAATAENGEAHIVAELPTEADVREVVERVRSEFSDVELVAKRDRERDTQTPREFRDELADRLTDAQRTALRAAYFSGYYRWPRDSTAEEIADALEISSPTFHQHLRKGQQELLGAFFDRTDE